MVTFLYWNKYWELERSNSSLGGIWSICQGSPNLFPWVLFFLESRWTSLSAIDLSKSYEDQFHEFWLENYRIQVLAMEIKAAAVAINGDNEENDGRKNNIVQALEKFRFEWWNKNFTQIKFYLNFIFSETMQQNQLNDLIESHYDTLVRGFQDILNEIRTFNETQMKREFEKLIDTTVLDIGKIFKSFLAFYNFFLYWEFKNLWSAEFAYQLSFDVLSLQNYIDESITQIGNCEVIFS